MMKKILFYDPYMTGHHPEYLSHPIHYYSKPRDSKGIIVCNRSLGAQLKGFAVECGSSVEFEFIDPQHQTKLSGARHLWHQGKADAACFAHYLQRCQPDLAVALSANPIQPFLNGGTCRRGETRIRGILFNPYPLAERSKAKESWKLRIKRLRKAFQVRWLARNPAIDKMFILNDAKVASNLNRITGNRGLFEPIPDPLPLYLEKYTVELVSGEQGDSGQLKLLFIGSINRRKGLMETLDAIRHLPSDVKQKIQLRIVGRFSDSSLRDEAVVQIQQLIEAGYLIELSEGWVTDEQFVAEMKACDVILAPYVGFHGSSGVIGHAAYFRKPLLATCEGLVGEIVQERRIGKVVQTRNPDLYAQEILKLMDEPWQFASQQAKYAAAMSSREFMKQLINEH